MTRLTRKEIQSLASAQGRRELGAFLAEGTRCVSDSLGRFELRELIATDEWLAAHRLPPDVEATRVSPRDIGRLSLQRSPQPVMAVFAIPDRGEWSYDGRLTLALDAIQDPGNLGTIIRMADWFGIGHILAGEGTADAWAPKVVQATMGALARVAVHRVSDLAGTLAGCGAPVIGTFLDGRDLYRTEIPADKHPVIVMGNEGNGISPAVAATVGLRLTIPSFPPGRATSESLNVAMAAGIVVSEISRRIYG